MQVVIYVTTHKHIKSACKIILLDVRLADLGDKSLLTLFLNSYVYIALLELICCFGGNLLVIYSAMYVMLSCIVKCEMTLHRKVM